MSKAAADTLDAATMLPTPQRIVLDVRTLPLVSVTVYADRAQVSRGITAESLDGVSADDVELLLTKMTSETDSSSIRYFDAVFVRCTASIK